MAGGDNRLRGARNASTSNFVRSDKVGKSDVEDLYRVSLSEKSSLDAQLSGLSRRASVGIELYRMKQPAAVVLKKLGSKDFRSLRSRDRNALLQLQGASRGRSTTKAIKVEAEAGDYIVRIVRSSGESRYRFNLNSSPIKPPVIPVPPDGNVGEEETPGNSFTLANRVTFPLAGSLSGLVSDQDGRDFYNLTVSEAGDYQVRLSGLGANANLEIYDANRNLVKASRKAGASQEALIQPQDAGSNFFIKVLQGAAGNTTPYTLDVRKLTDTIADDAATAVDANLSDTVSTTSNYVVANGKDSPKDVFKFAVTAAEDKQFLTARLIGLEDNLDIKLYREGADQSDANAFLSSSRPGDSSEIFKGTLREGTYFLEVIPGNPNTTTGSEYRLELALGDRTGASIVRDINFAEGASSNPQNVTGVQGLAYFTAVDGFDNSTGLWVSDGTLDKTRKIRNFKDANNFTTVGNTLFFSATDAVDGDTELWISDGTEGGTRSLNINPGVGAVNSSNPNRLAAIGNNLYFVATQAGQLKLMRSDLSGNVQPVSTTTNVLKDGPSGENTSIDVNTINKFTPIGSDLYFIGSDGTSGGFELYRVQNAATTSPAAQIQQIDVNKDSVISSFDINSSSELTQIGNILYSPVKVFDTVFGQAVTVMAQINLSNSTPLIQTISVDSPKKLNAIEDTLYFVDNSALKKIDNAGTVTPSAPTVTSIKPVSGISNVVKKVSTNSSDKSIYFFGADPSDSSIVRLWTSDGTDAGTTVVTTEVAISNTEPELVVVGDRIYFTAKAEPTELNPDSRDANNNFLPGGGTNLWVYDPNEIKSEDKVRKIDISDPGFAANPKRLINIGANTPTDLADDALFFVANGGPTVGYELWTI
jgi:ELWxxDGT repeat protein